MKRVLLSLASLCVIFGFAQAHAQDLKTYAVEETVVTATLEETRQEDIPQPVTVITHEEVAGSPAYNVGELLDYVPGVRIISAGTVGASHGVSIRSLNGGPASNKTLVLLDGRPLNDAWAGGINWNAVPFEIVDRVEIVRGPGSALYGSQATAGVVNVITKRPESGFHGWFSLGQEMNISEDITDTAAEGYGRAEVSATRVGLNGSFATERAGHFVSLGYRKAQESFPTPLDDDWDNYDILYRGNYDIRPDVTSDFTLTVHDDAWENHTDRIPQEVASQGVAADFAATWQTGRGKLDGRVYVNHNVSENRIFRTDLTTGQTSDRIGVMADYALPLGTSAMLIGGIDGYFDTADVDYDKTVVDMTALGIGTVNLLDSRTGQVTQVEADTFQGVYGSDNQSYDENNIALFLQYSRTVYEKMNVVAGGRLDIHSVFGSVFNPILGFTYDLFERNGFATTLKVNYGTAFRSPPMVDLFSQSLDGYGDPDMNPEKTKNIDIGFFQRLSTFGTAEITFYHMDVTDLMINDKLGSTGDGYYVFIPASSGVDTLSFQQRMNLGSYSPKGVEVGFKVWPHRYVTLSGSYTYLDPGDFTFQTSKHRYNVGVTGSVPVGAHRVEAEALYNYTGDGYFFDYETRPYDAFSTADARLSFDYRDRTRVSLHIKNLFDETYQLWHYAWQPGRTLLVSVESRF